MLIFMPKLNFEEKERERYSFVLSPPLLPFSLAMYSAQFPPCPRPDSPRPSGSQPFVNTAHPYFPRLEPRTDGSNENSTAFYGHKLIVNFCVLVCDRVRCYILLLPSPTERKRKQLRLEDYFFFPSLLSCLKNFREREMTNGGCFESCESREGLIQENFSHVFSNCEISE